MAVDAVTHLNFRGEARAALAFYQSVLGGDTVVVTYGDAQHVPDGTDADHVMWGQVVAGNGFRVMAYDVPAGQPWSRGENSFFLSLRGDATAEISEYWAGLSAGATVRQPLAPSAWAPLYGMLTDKFGVTWVLDVAAS
ncbi:VOC family protein [Nocardia blacklockiae]|uniref:VOC family protein n=1 Tax=Nocardia blacklockiae TaxID=480036 RepID=UPI001893C060|nr:VOC family protein [Nocardia blacklockiae]MBF6172196.1 VOC family protein [Nocardia blacklockiae]